MQGKVTPHSIVLEPADATTIAGTPPSRKIEQLEVSVNVLHYTCMGSSYREVMQGGASPQAVSRACDFADTSVNSVFHASMGNACLV